MSLLNKTVQMMILPSDLIILISRLFWAANDVLSFGLINKRHSNILFANIKDKNNKAANTLLELHTTKVQKLWKQTEDTGYGIDIEYLSAELLFLLPNSIIHGAVKEWQVKEQYFNELKNLADPPENWKYSCIQHLGTIREGAKQAKAEEILMQHGSLKKEGQKFLGKYEGTLKRHNYFGDSLVSVEECNYTDGEKHGTEIHQGVFSNNKQLTDFVNGQQNGLHRRYEEGKLVIKALMKNDKMHGEVEHYRIVEDCDSAVLYSRAHYDNGDLDGLSETWHPNSGIRTQLQLYSRGLRHGVRLVWDEDLGSLIASEHFMNDERHGMEEGWDSVSGVKTSMGCWKHGEEFGPFDQFHYITRTRIASERTGKRPDGGRYQEVVENWDAESGILIKLCTSDASGNSVLQHWYAETGGRRTIVRYEDSKRHGLSESWTRHGEKISSILWIQGKQQGGDAISSDEREAALKRDNDSPFLEQDARVPPPV